MSKKQHRYPSKGRRPNNPKSSTPTIVVERPPEQARRQPKIPPGGVNFKPVNDALVAQMYMNMGPQAQQDPYYAPGAPIRPVPGLTPQEGPRGFQYEQGYNIAQLPRGTEDYSFNDLRAIAAASDFIQMCEQVWFDYISKLELVIEPRPELVGEDGDASMYDNDIQNYQDFFAFPDRHHDLKEWLRMMVRDQLEIDAVALFPRKNRIGGLYSLDVIDASTIKPLVTDRGRRPDPPYPAYEQFVYGVPACLLTCDDLIYVKETERTESVYGKSRVEKIIFRLMMELRKQSKDLARFTDGSLPGGFITQAPESVDWTQEEVEDYEAQVNDQLAGNDVMRARLKVLPRGFDYKPTDDPDIHVDLDMLILNLVAAMFGLSMDELAITLNSNRSVGESQENMIYRRVMQPLMNRYANLIMQVLKKYFNETRFIVKWKGFEEQEDFTTKATGFATLVGAGIQSPTQAAREMNLQVYNNMDIGPYVLTKSGPTFLEDAADPKMRKAQQDAQLAGLELAKNNPGAAKPGQNGEEGDTEDEKEQQSTSKPEEDEQPPSSKDGSQAKSTGKATDGSAKSDGKASGKEPAAKLTKDGASAKRSADGGPRTEIQGSGLLPHGASFTRSHGDNGGQTHTGIMVAFMLDPVAAQQLALPGGEPPEQLHVTLAYMGNVTDTPPEGKLNPAETRMNITTALSSFATSSPILEGSTSGIGRFAPSDNSDGLSPIVALVNVTGLQAFRHTLVDVLKSAGYHVAQNFDYLAHITLKYINPAQHMPVDYIESVPLRFDKLCLAIGDEQYYFPLGAQNGNRRHNNGTNDYDLPRGGQDDHGGMHTTGRESNLRSHEGYAIASHERAVLQDASRDRNAEGREELNGNKRSQPVDNTTTTYEQPVTYTRPATASDRQERDRTRWETGESRVSTTTTTAIREGLDEQRDTTDTSQSSDGSRQDSRARWDEQQEHKSSISAEYKRWRACAVSDIGRGRSLRPFETDSIPIRERTRIQDALERCQSADEVKEVFRAAQSTSDFHWQDADPEIQRQIADLRAKGVTEQSWSCMPGACDNCMLNDGKTVLIGERFPNGCYTDPCHGHCQCKTKEIYG